MNGYEVIPAHYTPTGSRQWDGNPLIEALTPNDVDDDKLLNRMEYFPPSFTTKDRAKPNMVRRSELSALGAMVYPFAEYERTAIGAAEYIRNAYVCRNPMTAAGQRRRTLIATAAQYHAHMFRSSAVGQMIMAITGGGKTTFGGAFFEPYCIVIEHTKYRGKPFKCLQVPAIRLSVANDGSLKGLCIQFFELIDAILGTNYAREARSVRNTPAMAQLFIRVATAVSLGGIFIDDLHHLRAARGALAEMVLNFFSQLVEIAGIYLMLSATPALEPVLHKNVKNIRKVSGGGCSRFPVMSRNDEQWLSLCRVLWNRYRIVRQLEPLDTTILDAWHYASGGDPAFTLMSFMLAQRIEIGGREMLDALALRRVAETEMCLLRPAIDALISGDPKRLAVFDDLVFKRGLKTLQQQLGLGQNEQEPIDSAEDELEEFESEEAASVPDSAPAPAPASAPATPTKATQSRRSPSHKAPRKPRAGGTPHAPSSPIVLPTIKPNF